MKKRVLSILLAALMVVSLLPTVALATETAGLDNFEKVQTYTDGKFTDVKADDWFEKNVSSAYELNLMVGKSEDFFDTESNLTVAEAMTIAARLRSIYYTGKAEFEQGNPWYQAYTDYCKANGVADPADYDMNKAITRGEFAEIFAKALPADALKKINTVQDNMIPDVKKADKFSAAIYLLYRAGVLVGNDAKGTFASDTNIKRVEVAAITTRMAQPALRESIRLVKPSSGGGRHTPPAPAPTTYTVEFNMNGHGEQIEPITGVISGSKISAPPAPSADGWKFKVWYIDSDCATEWKFDTDTVTKNTILYAKWVEVKTVADILATDDSFPNSAEKAWTAGGLAKCYNNGNLYFVSVKPTISLPLTTETTDVTGSGDDFICVDSNVTFTFKMTEGKLTAIVVSGSVVLDGTYTAPAPATTYTVTFNMQGHGTQIDPITNVASNAKITAPPAPSAAGWKFKGWYKDSDCAAEWKFDTDTVTKNTILYAKWVETVGYVIGNNFPTKDVVWTNGNSSTCYYEPFLVALTPSLVFSKTEPNGYAYVFLVDEVTKVTDGYTYRDDNRKFTITFNMDVDDLVSIVFDADNEADDSIRAVEGTYTAPTPATTYTVTFDLNGVGDAIDPQTVDKNGKVIRPVDPTDSTNAHTFAGWYIDGEYETEWNFGTDVVTGDITLYAKWETTIEKLVGAIPTSENKDTAPSNAWTAEGDYGTNKCYVAENKLYFLSPKDDDVKSTGIVLSTKVVKVGNTYLYSNGVITFAMTDGNLSSIKFKNSNTSYTKYDGTYKPALATLTMKAGDTEYNWNKITVTIKGIDTITSGSYTFGKVGVDSLIIELTSEQIESVNNDVLTIYKEDLDPNTDYKMALVVSNSAGVSQTIVATYKTGDAPPP